MTDKLLDTSVTALDPSAPLDSSLDSYGLPVAHIPELDFSEPGAPGSVFQARRVGTTTGAPRILPVRSPFALSLDPLAAEASEILAQMLGIPEHAPQVKTVAIRLVSAGMTVTKAASLLGIHVVTLMSWQSEPDMQAAIREGAELRALRIASRVEDVAMTAIDEVETILRSSASPAVKLRAAEMIMDRTPGTNPAAIAAAAKQPAGPAAPLVEITFSERLARVVAGNLEG